jgi:hypothetical protein
MQCDAMLWGGQVGMGLFSAFPTPQDTDFTVVVSGATCTPCKALLPILKQLPAAKLQEGIDAAWTGKAITSLLNSSLLCPSSNMKQLS